MSTRPRFVHLNTCSAFSFGDDVFSVGSLVLRAAEQGQTALALTDTIPPTLIVSLTHRC